MDQARIGNLLDVIMAIVLLSFAYVVRDSSIGAHVFDGVAAILLHQAAGRPLLKYTANRLVDRRAARASRNPPPPPSGGTMPPPPAPPSGAPPTQGTGDRSLRLALAVALLGLSLAACATGYRKAVFACVDDSTTRDEYEACKRGVNLRYGRDAGPREDGGR